MSSRGCRVSGGKFMNMALIRLGMLGYAEVDVHGAESLPGFSGVAEGRESFNRAACHPCAGYGSGFGHRSPAWLSFIPRISRLLMRWTSFTHLETFEVLQFGIRGRQEIT